MRKIAVVASFPRTDSHGGFLDGNGRIGRLLMGALLEHWGLLRQPPMPSAASSNRPASSTPTARAAVKLLEDLGIVAEITGQTKNRVYSYKAYVELLCG